MTTKYPNWVDDTQIQMSDNARRVFTERYLCKDDKGEIVETVAEAMYRVAMNVACYGLDRFIPEDYWTRRMTMVGLSSMLNHKINYNDIASDQFTEYFYGLMSDFRFLPNTPTWTGAGTPLGQLSACFVLPIEDDMESIFETLKTAALIQQSGGGVGFSFSRLRSRGSLVSKSKGVATGPVGFMRVYDAAFGEIAQGGARRGANMAVLRIDHPDIEEFIACKHTEGILPTLTSRWLSLMSS